MATQKRLSFDRIRLTPREAITTLANAGCLSAAPTVGEIAPSDVAGQIVVDSRQVEPGAIFIAFKGVHADGHDHIATAIARGASLIIAEDTARLGRERGVLGLGCRDGRVAWSHLAAKATAQAHASLAMVAVTGTNGKTSTAWICGELLRAAGSGCLTVGTLGAGFDSGLPTPTGFTTPDPDLLYPLLAEAGRRQLPFVAMEASSHALTQGKLAPLCYRGAAFTSFSRDHLDYHATMEAYWEAKERLFLEHLTPTGLCAFSDGLDRLPRHRPDQLAYVYGFDAKARAAAWGIPNALCITRAKEKAWATELQLTDGSLVLEGELPYAGRLALENFCAALLLARALLGHYPAAACWREIRQVPGRLERVASPAPGGPRVFVDYAHTPDALAKTLAMLRTDCHGRLVVVFGCGGDRDRGKRGQMGAIAEALADRVVVTSDNPRSEEPRAIVAAIVAGMKRPAAATCELDREAAIQLAIAEAREDDTILIAGKGHETYQIIGQRTLAFDDRTVASAALAARSHGI